jgi:hypothetical protein
MRNKFVKVAFCFVGISPALSPSNSHKNLSGRCYKDKETGTQESSVFAQGKKSF